MKTIRAALTIAFAGGVAHADISADDIKNAAQLNINSAQVSLDGVPFDTTMVDASLPKPTGSLTFDIPASALGIPIANLSVHAVGSPIGNGKIFFQTTNYYKPAITLPDGSTVASEFGTFTMQTWSLGGAESPSCGAQPCAGGTGFEVIGGSMTMSGSFGTMTLGLDQGRGVGGVTRAKLGALKSPPVHLNANAVPELPVCSGAQETRALMKIALGSTAPTGGSRVDLTSTATNLRFAHTLWLASGTDTAAVDVAIPAGFTGTATMTAASGGKTGTATLDVRPASACVPPSQRFTIERIGNCVGCTAFGSLNNEGDRIIALDGTVNFAHAGTSISLVKQFGATAVGASSINDAGQIAGRLTRNGVTQAYRADMLDGSHQPVLLGEMTPMAITQGGTVVGFRDDSTGKHIPVINRGSGIFDIPLASGYGVKAARALFMTQDTTIVGTYTGNDNVVRGYRYRNGVTTTLPAIGDSWALPTGINANGAIAVNAGSVAAVVAKSGAVMQYGSPSGFSSFVVKDINKWGYAIGSATCATCASAIQRAFVYIPGSGFRALSGYVSNLAFADDALAINDDNQIAIHGALVGNPTPDYFLLSL